jgi:hypothetical protein
MINDAITLKGCIDTKYANFFLSLLEENKHNSLITKDLVQEFCSGSYDYPDEFIVTGIPKGWTENQDWYEVFHLLKDIQKTLSFYLRKTYYNDAVCPMETDSSFKSVFTDISEAFIFGLSDKRPTIEIEMYLNCWNLLKRVCEIHKSNWQESLYSD